MNTEILQLIVFLWISGAFIGCVGFVVWPLIITAIRDMVSMLRSSPAPVRHEAVILQFRPRTKGRLHG